jgi:hypothetical protein
VKPADENVMHTQKDFDHDVDKNPYLKVAGIFSHAIASVWVNSATNPLQLLKNILG